MKQLLDNTEDVRQWLLGQIEDPEVEPGYVFGVLGEDGIESAVGYYNLKPGVSVCMAWAGKMTRRFLALLWSHAFDGLKVKTVLGTVASDNVKCLKLARQMGCREIGTFLKGYDGERDYVIFQMLPEECKWLGGRYGTGR